jgi:hypothetical protein
VSETPIDMGMASAPPAGAAASPAPPSQPSPPQQPPRVPDTRGHSPARDHREQQPSAGERMISINGTDYAEQSVLDAMADRAQRQIVQAGLPRDPNGYEIKLPEGFKPPEGMQFEFNADDPALKQFREIAHRRGMDQGTFSEALGAFASVKVAELAQTNAARDAQMAQLGSAADTRIDQVATWLKAKVGDKANILIATLKQFPVAANVEALEGIIRAFSSQGGTNFTQSGRDQPDEGGKIPGYENMSFTQKRIAQMQGTPPQRGSR